jgi:hypothetical protein
MSAMHTAGGAPECLIHYGRYKSRYKRRLQLFCFVYNSFWAWMEQPNAALEWQARSL